MVLIWLSFVSPRPVKRHDRLGRTREALDRAGLTGTSVTGLWAVYGATATVVFVAVEVVSSTVSVSLAFGLLAGYLPVAMVVGRGRRRQRELAEVWPEVIDNLVYALRAGMSLPEALSQLGPRGPEPLR